MIPSSAGATCLLQHLSSFPAGAPHRTMPQPPASLELYIPPPASKPGPKMGPHNISSSVRVLPSTFAGVCSPTRLQTLGWTIRRDGFCHHNASYAELPQQGPNGPSTVWWLPNPTRRQALSSPPRCPCSWPALETRAAHAFLSGSHNWLKAKTLLPPSCAKRPTIASSSKTQQEKGTGTGAVNTSTRP